MKKLWPEYWAGIKADLAGCVGVPYRLGAEVSASGKFPPDKIDCSELIELVYARAGIPVPDGSWVQHHESYPVDNPRVGDLCFLARLKSENNYNPEGIYHVGILYTPSSVIEAYGKPKSKVIIRSRKMWQAKRNFKRAGGWRRLKIIKKRGLA